MLIFFVNNTKLNNHPGYAVIDYAGGGVVATGEDLLKFMKALARGEIIEKDTFEKMKDFAKYTVGIDYGYGLMNFRPVPLVMPKKFNSWGSAGITGSFMFYNPGTDAYLIGNLNQFYYDKKGIRLMFQIINKLSKVKHTT